MKEKKNRIIDYENDADGENECIPTIDMNETDESKVGKELIDAFRRIGFAILTNHGVPSRTVSSAFDASKQFFGQSLEEKLKYKYQGANSNRGYIAAGKETHDKVLDQKPDLKESFDIGDDGDEQHVNNWPEFQQKEEKEAFTGEKFRLASLAYIDAFDSLHLRIMRLLALGLELDDPNYFVTRCNERHVNMRMLSYPSLQLSSSSSHVHPHETDMTKKVLVRGNEHTDYGTITLLAQDDIGGLQARRINNSWASVRPLDGTEIVVNVGDILQRWTNNVLRATPHRVTATISSTATTTNNDNKNDGKEADDEGVISVPHRFSIAFFCNANRNVMVDCLDACITEDRPKAYDPIRSEDYLRMRLGATIAK